MQGGRKTSDRLKWIVRRSWILSWILWRWRIFFSSDILPDFPLCPRELTWLYAVSFQPSDRRCFWHVPVWWNRICGNAWSEKAQWQKNLRCFQVQGVLEGCVTFLQWKQIHGTDYSMSGFIHDSLQEDVHHQLILFCTVKNGWNFLFRATLCLWSWMKARWSFSTPRVTRLKVTVWRLAMSTTRTSGSASAPPGRETTVSGAAIIGILIADSQDLTRVRLLHWKFLFA